MQLPAKLSKHIFFMVVTMAACLIVLHSAYGQEGANGQEGAHVHEATHEQEGAHVHEGTHEQKDVHEGTHEHEGAHVQNDAHVHEGAHGQEGAHVHEHAHVQEAAQGHESTQEQKVAHGQEAAHGQEEASVVAKVIQDIDLSFWQQAHSGKQKLLVLLYQPDSCDKCKVTLDSVAQLVGQPEIPSDLEIVKSSNADLVSHLGVNQFPSLVYLRENSHVTYDGSFGVEDLLEWVQLATQQVTHALNDESFEHLTQASTGATTGDWLVVFYKDTCKNVLLALDTLGVRLHGRINVAKVNIPDSPSQVERFKVSECPEIIFFRQGRMYRYTLPVLDVASLRSFVDGFYKNVQAQPVPIPKSNFDFLTENIADYIKIQLEGENRNAILAGLVGVVTSFLFLVICCFRSTGGDTRKEKKE